MNVLKSWGFWTITYLISAILFAQSFKKANKNMKNASLLTVLLELFTALFSILLIPLFKIKFPTDITIYITLLIVAVIYAVTDRLNIEARYGLDPSVFSMLKQLSTVFIIILGMIFLKEPFVLKKIIGAVIIIFANILLTFNKGRLKINKYFIMSFISNFCFAIAMLINVGISDNFNIAIYTMLTVSIPAFLIMLIGKYKIKDLRSEFNLYNKKLFIFSSAMWSLMLISSVKAYELGNIVLVASLFSLTSILNAFIEFIFNKNRGELLKKVIVSILIIIGVILVRIN